MTVTYNENLTALFFFAIGRLRLVGLFSFFRHVMMAFIPAAVRQPISSVTFVIWLFKMGYIVLDSERTHCKG